jgi:ribose transport system ATP-binding protein
MTVCVVTASFTLTAGEAWYVLFPGALALVGVGLVVGLFNVVLIKILGLSSIIATLATLSILQGVSLWLRPTPEGTINSGLISALLKSVTFIPIAFIGVVVVAILADLWLYRSSGGLTARAVGLDETAASRRGARVGFIFVRALFISAFAASIGAFFLAAQVGVGDPRVGLGFTLTSIAAAVLGGASLIGGRGSFVGAVIGALFLNMIVNILPFLGWSTAYGRILVGSLTLLALVFYQGPELLARMRTAAADFRASRSTAGPSARLR